MSAGLLTGVPPDWRHRARCRDEDPELFFPVGTTGPWADQIAEAKAVCKLCPVRLECLQWALETAQDAGVWGGMDEVERRWLRTGKRLARDRHGTKACYDANGCRCGLCKRAKANANHRKRLRKKSP